MLIIVKENILIFYFYCWEIFYKYIVIYLLYIVKLNKIIKNLFIEIIKEYISNVF